MRRRWAAAPAEGWLSLILVAVLAVIVAWSLDDAALVLGRREWTDFLAWMSLAGVLVGFIGARARWSRLVAHLVGAAFAALVIPIVVGGILDPAGSPADRFAATAGSTVNAVLDFAVRGLPLTRETGHYLLVLGVLCWANGQFAASSVFRDGRPFGPIIVLGTVLIANMSATDRDQLWLLVAFTLVALFLLTRLHALEERATWVRRRIGDPTTVGSLYLRGGTVFILAAVFGSMALTATARSAPLAGFWDDARPALVEVSQWLQRIVPAAPDSRSLGVPSFGQQVTIGGVWSTSNDPALEIFRKPGNDRRYYWRATVYDTFTLFGWTSTAPTTMPRTAGSSILGGTLDAIPLTSVRATESFRVVPQSGLFRVAFSPIDPLTIDRDTSLITSGDNGYFQSIAIPARTTYTVTAAVEDLVDVAGGVTQNRLRAAGTAYPAAILARYTSVPALAMGPAASRLLGVIQARVKASGRDTPFDIATAMVDELHTSQYQYSTSVPGVCDRDPSIVECFASHKIGYCEYYASTMAILLRAQGIPARIAEGFLPGQIDVATGRETVTAAAAHAWVEVWFPGIGWYRFDPTGGGRSAAEPIPVGSAVPIATPTPKASLSFSSGDPRLGADQPGRSSRPAGGAGVSVAGPGNAPLVAIAIMLLGAILLVGFLAWRRGPRGLTTPDGVFTSVSGLARRFGFGPRPAETAYEYASALGEALPAMRPALATVATAKVEVAYGRRELGAERLRAVRDSYRRLRVGLLRLAFRRGGWRRPR